MTFECRRASDDERRRAREIADEVLAGRMSILEGTRALLPLARSDAILLDEDRKSIIGIESETDDLPIGEVRKYWRPESLREKDVEIARCEELYRDNVLAVCRRIQNSR